VFRISKISRLNYFTLITADLCLLKSYRPLMIFYKHVPHLFISDKHERLAEVFGFRRWWKNIL